MSNPNDIPVQGSSDIPIAAIHLPSPVLLAPTATSATRASASNQVSGKRAYRAACARCKASKQRCAWMQGPEDDPPSSCAPCQRRNLLCPGVPAPAPRRRRATPPALPPTAVSLSPTSASSAANDSIIAIRLSESLLQVFRSHWDLSPVGLGTLIPDIFLAAAGRPDSLGNADKVIYYSTLALAARVSSDVAISGPAAPPLSFVDSPDANEVDLSPYGLYRTRPCNILASKAVGAWEPTVLFSEFGLQSAMLMAHLAMTSDDDLSTQFLDAAITKFRVDTRRPHLSPEKQAELYWNARTIALLDAAQACYSRRPPLLSDEEIHIIMPPRNEYHFEIEFDYLALIQSLGTDKDIEDVLPTGSTDASDETRIYIMREVAVLFATPPHLVPAQFHRIRDIWDALDTSRALSSGMRDVLTTFRREMAAAGLGVVDDLRIQQLLSCIPALIGRASLIQFSIHSGVQAWVQEAYSADTALLQLLHESTTQTRRSLKFVADNFRDYLTIRRGKSVPISQTFLRLESSWNWVEIALERLDTDIHEELTLEELELLAVGMRLSGWSFGRASIRLRELEGGILAIKQQEFDAKIQVKDFLFQYLDFSVL